MLNLAQILVRSAQSWSQSPPGLISIAQQLVEVVLVDIMRESRLTVCPNSQDLRLTTDLPSLQTTSQAHDGVASRSLAIQLAMLLMSSGVSTTMATTAVCSHIVYARIKPSSTSFCNQAIYPPKPRSKLLKTVSKPAH